MKLWNARQKQAAARLKALITDPAQLIKPKGVDAYFAPMHARLFFTSNDMEDAIFLNSGATDRRYSVLGVSGDWCDKVKDYWLPFVKWLETPGNLAKIHKWLIQLEYARELIRRPIETSVKNTMSQNSWDPVDSWLAAMLARKHVLSEEAHERWYDTAKFEGARRTSEESLDRREWPEWVNGAALVKDFSRHVRQAFGHATYANEKMLLSKLRHRGLLVDGVKSKRMQVMDYSPKDETPVRKRVRMHPTPSEQSVRDYLLGRYGFTVETDDEVEEIELTNDF